MSTTTHTRSKYSRPTVPVPQGLGRALLALVALLTGAGLAVSLVPGLLLVAGLALWAGLLALAVVAPFAVVHAVAMSA